MKKLLLVALGVALGAGAVVGGLAYREAHTPKAVVWSSEKTLLPTPYCPRCAAEVEPFAQVCGQCGGPLAWPNRDEMKARIAEAKQAAGQAIEEGAEAADRIIRDAEEWTREQVESVEK